jgi:hypothetical protein
VNSNPSFLAFKEFSVSRLGTAFLIIAGLLPLISFAIWNGYPLVYSDTGTYIHAGFENLVPDDRPILYGIFIRHLSLKTSLWIVICIQALLTSFSLFVFISGFISERKRRNSLFVICILFLSFGTAISQKCSDLLPDFLTAMMALLICRFMVKPILGIEKLLVFAVLFFALCAHNSHLYILLLTISVVIFIRLFRKSVLRLVPFRKFLHLLGILISGVLVIGFINYGFSGKFFISKNSAVFMTGHLAECGLLDEFLNAKCAEKKYALCPDAGRLNKVDFLWDERNSPLYRMGGWKNDGEQFKPLLYDFFTSKKYLGKFAVNSLGCSAKQLTMFQLDAEMENAIYGEGSAPYAQIHWRFHSELENYMASKQNRGLLDYSWVNFLQTILLLLSIMVIAAFYLIRKIREQMQMIHISLLFILSFIFSNAVVCGTFTIAHVRFGSRVIWLLPLMAIIIVAEYVKLRNKQNTVSAPKG